MTRYHHPEMISGPRFQVTLASGRIVTSPEDLAETELVSAEDYYHPVFAEDGRLLTVAAENARRGREGEPAASPPR